MTAARSSAPEEATRSASIIEAAQRLAAGGLVAFPTETVYGLGARADQDDAVARIFAAKGRPADHPLIVHVSDAAAADWFAEHIPEVARRLMTAFWPGPVTVIVPRRPGMAAACAGGQDSIGLRCPSHPVARALLAAAAQRGVPGVAAPSANRFGRVSPTTAEHVRQEFGADLPVVDGGPCEVGIESTIIDCTRGVPVLLRPGVLTRGELQTILGQPVMDPDGHAPRASGTLESHYAPACRVRVMKSDTFEHELAETALPSVALYSVERPPCPMGMRCIWRPMDTEAPKVAQDLFSALRELDAWLQAAGGGEIWVQEPSADPEWEGVRDRLRRAAA